MADNLEKKCEYCGATYIVSDGYCKKCWKRIPTTASPKEELLDGVKKAEWHFFIDKNASRYVDIYAENEGKRLFAGWNWAAFFFGNNWMFYRKMYKAAVICSFIYSLIAVLVMLAVSAAYSGQLKPLYEEVAAYEQNFNTDSFFAENSSLKISVNGQPIMAYEAREKIDFITKKIVLISAFILLLSQLPLGLFGDCIYKAHILKKIKYSDGGVSYIAFWVGGACNAAFDRIIVSPLAIALIKLLMN